MRYGPQVTAHRAATALGQEGLGSMLRIADRTEAEAFRVERIESLADRQRGRGKGG
jgi:hypothetical protein